MFSIGLNSVCRPMIVFLFRLISRGRNTYHSQPASPQASITRGPEPQKSIKYKYCVP